jgi:hypothetical protein
MSVLQGKKIKIKYSIKPSPWPWALPEWSPSLAWVKPMACGFTLHFFVWGRSKQENIIATLHDSRGVLWDLRGKGLPWWASTPVLDSAGTRLEVGAVVAGSRQIQAGGVVAERAGTDRRLRYPRMCLSQGPNQALKNKRREA